MSAARFAPNTRRRALLAKLHLGAKEMRLDEVTRRDLIERVTGHRSAAECSDEQLVAVVEEFKRRGWTAHPAKPRPAPASRTRMADHPVAKKARALWISLWQLGEVRDPSERALEAFARRQLGVERLQWADQGQGFRLIEALKAMAERAGWSQDLAGVPADRQVEVLKRRLMAAQAAKLHARGHRLAGAQETLDDAIAEFGLAIGTTTPADT